MKPLDPTEQHLTAYLLGKLSGEEEEGIEERYLGDKEYLDQLETLEDELIDAYVQQRLTGPDRACFENHFLKSPGRRARVLFAESWWSFVSKRDSGARENRGIHAVTTFLRGGRSPASAVLVPLAASALLLMITSYLIIRTYDLNGDLEQVRVELSEFQQRTQVLENELAEERDNRERLAEEVSRPKADSKELIPLTQGRDHDAGPFYLVAGLTRGEQKPNSVSILEGTGFVKMRVVIRDDQSESYRGVLRSEVKSDEVWKGPGRKIAAQRGVNTIEFRIPASTLSAGWYILYLNRITEQGESENIEEYHFLTIKERRDK